MRFEPSHFISSLLLLLLASVGALSSDIRKDASLSAGGTIEIDNRYGRVALRALEKEDKVSIVATGPSLSGSELKVSGSGGRLIVTVETGGADRRVDLVITVPERIKARIETSAGSIEIVGNVAVVDARSDTGTIITDVPAEMIDYRFFWTESRPRILADFEIAAVKEKSAGRFEIKGKHAEEQGRKKPKKNATAEPDTDVPSKSDDEAVEKRSKKNADLISLDFTTARGIVLLNVPPNEVMSDLRERPLTNAAKAIVRSGDSLLMEAIRRASPKYFGDYMRTLPPIKQQPSFSQRRVEVENPVAAVKTASVRATDVHNRAVSGLTVNDFEVLEAGVEREVISAEQSKAPFNLVLLLDVSGSVENYQNFIRKTARNFVNTVGAEDRVSIVIFNEDVKMLSTFTTDKGKLSESLDTFDAGGGTAFYDALAYVISDTLRPLRGDRSAIVVLTDGDDNRSFLAFDSLMGSIQESGALIYPLYVPSGLIAQAAQGADIDPLRKKYMSLTAKSEGEGEKLAKVSGGVYYPISEIGQIQKAYEDIVLQLRSAYNVTFRSSAAPAAKVQRLKIKVRREDIFTTVTSVVPANGQ